MAGGQPKAMVFVVAMMAGMLAFEWLDRMGRRVSATA
jgi:hypothetical protein